MKLSDNVLNIVKTGNNRLLLAQSLNLSEQSIIRHIKANRDNGVLTKTASINEIKKQTGLKESQILVP